MQCLTPADRILPVNGDIKSDFPHRLSKFRRSRVLHSCPHSSHRPASLRLTRGSLLFLRIRGSCHRPSPSVAPKGAGSIQPSLIASFRRTWLGNSHGTDVFEAEDIRRSSLCWRITPKVRGSRAGNPRSTPAISEPSVTERVLGFALTVPYSSTEWP